MTVRRAARLTVHAAALALVAGVACSSSSRSIPDGSLAIEAGPADASTEGAPGDDAADVDGASDAGDATAPGNDSGAPPPSDAAPVDAAFACANPSGVSDCGYCRTRAACEACALSVAPSGPGKAVLQCTECTACYTACNGALAGCSMPSSPNACDLASASGANCATCQACADNQPEGDAANPNDGLCASIEQDCIMSVPCAEFLHAAQSACAGLP
jgi:hypothetical protein